MTESIIPKESYGILQRNLSDSSYDEAVEQLRNLGYAIINSGYTATELQSISKEFNRIREDYVKVHGESKLRSLNEFHTIRSPLTMVASGFLSLR